MLFTDYGIEVKVDVEVEHGLRKSLVKTIGVSLGLIGSDTQFLLNGKSIGVHHAINEYATDYYLTRIYTFDRFVHDVTFITRKAVGEINRTEDRMLNGKYFNPEFSHSSEILIATAHRDPTLVATYYMLLSAMVPPDRKRGATIRATYNSNHNL